MAKLNLNTYFLNAFNDREHLDGVRQVRKVVPLKHQKVKAREKERAVPRKKRNQWRWMNQKREEEGVEREKEMMKKRQSQKERGAVGAQRKSNLKSQRKKVKRRRRPQKEKVAVEEGDGEKLRPHLLQWAEGGKIENKHIWGHQNCSQKLYNYFVTISWCVFYEPVSQKL